MNIANLELCKALYEVSGWGLEPEAGLMVDEYGTSESWKTAPRYTLGYLLRKLPQKIDGKINYWFHLSVGHDSEWFAWYDGTTYQAYADTPENAACKLAIELFKQGILVK